MGKKPRGGSGRSLGGLADALVKAGIAETGQAERARSERARERRTEPVSGPEAAREETARMAPRVIAPAGGPKTSGQLEQLQERLRRHRDTGRGNKRWFFVARDGRIPFVEVPDAVARLLGEGQAGIVESLGAVADAHVVVRDVPTLETLESHDSEAVRFWNRGGGRS